MGLQIKLTDAVTDTSIPIFYPEAFNTTGSLMLLDASDLGVTGVPTSGQLLKNSVKTKAMALLSATESAVSPAFNTGSSVGGSASLIERTSKGALHGIISKTNDVSGQTNYKVSIPAAIKQYIADNPSHDFYIGTWTKSTRAAGTVSASHCQYCQDGNNLYFILEDGTSPNAATDGSRYLGSQRTPNAIPDYMQTTGNKYYSLGFNGHRGSPSPASTAGNDNLFVVGTFANYAPFLFHNSWSLAMYRVYLEDLTVSGRTYEEVNSLDYQAFQAAFATGGRFDGDTYTDPSTLP